MKVEEVVSSLLKCRTSASCEEASVYCRKDRIASVASSRCAEGGGLHPQARVMCSREA